MIENQDKINQLLRKLELLSAKQETFQKEMQELRGELLKLQKEEEETIIIEQQEVETPTSPIDFIIIPTEEKKTFEFKPEPEPKAPEAPFVFTNPKDTTPKFKQDLEKFIGENLINKIGILITIIGVSIGVKYSIDHQLISPSTRIVLGYLMGLGLLGVGFKLKKKYHNYSAVLVSGAMAIMYFMTFAAYSFYALLPQAAAFVIMVIITVSTVFAALTYNSQVIALIGLVGAYAVPFLLSDGSGKVAVLYTYMAIINIGILVIAFKKYWKLLYYSAFCLTWIIYASWFGTAYKDTEHFQLALLFLTVFFVIFYVTFLAYKLFRKEKFSFDAEDIILLLSNSFLFFGFGYSIIYYHNSGDKWVGLFTVCNALIHLIVSAIIYKQKLADKNLLYLVIGLFIIFITIAIPVQLDGNWVTLLWAGESALLFWIGRTKKVAFYEVFSYPLMFLAFFSLITEWSSVYAIYARPQHAANIVPIFNTTFLTSMLFIAAFSFINVINRSKKNDSPLLDQNGLIKLISFSIPAILLFVLYFSIRMEIANYWDQMFASSSISIKAKGQTLADEFSNYDLQRFKSIWIHIYSLFFLTILSIVNIKRIKNTQLGMINIGLNVIFLLLFLIDGLYMISELRDTYLHQTLAEYYYRSGFNIGIRYLSFVFVAAIIYATYKYIQEEFINYDFSIAFDIMLYGTILWIASSELISWMDMANSTQSYKLGLSILWGIYALLLIVLGIWKKKKHLRIGAIVIFSLTLLKLFLYDISYLDTISKTIVFVSLGILLLIISFLYNKYKGIISNETEEEE